MVWLRKKETNVMGETLDNALITLNFTVCFGLTHSGMPKYDGSCLIG
jgi:hypothetical protein